MWPYVGPIPTYSILYNLSIVSQFLVGWLVARRWGLRRRVWMTLGLCYLLGMTVGAKALYDIQHGPFRFGALLSLDHYTAGGLWGGPLAYLALAVPLGWLVARRKRAVLDLTVLTLPIPMILAKVGCLMNGCCYGRPTSVFWAITFPESEGPAPSGLPLHPTQIYEMLVLAVILIVLVKLDRRRWEGTLLLWFLALYGAGRALTEVFRGDLDEHVSVGPFSLSQVICVAVACVSIVVLAVRCRHATWPPVTTGDDDADATHTPASCDDARATSRLPSPEDRSRAPQRPKRP